MLELAFWVKVMAVACGVGGTVIDRRIEIQGEKGEEMMRVQTDAGYKLVFAADWVKLHASR